MCTIRNHSLEKWQLRVYTILAEDLSFVPSTRVGISMNVHCAYVCVCASEHLMTLASVGTGIHMHIAVSSLYK